MNERDRGNEAEGGQVEDPEAQRQRTGERHTRQRYEEGKGNTRRRRGQQERTAGEDSRRTIDK